MWNANQSFHVSSATDATNVDSPVTALGCQTKKRIRLRNAPVVRLRLVVHLIYERSRIGTEAAESG